MAGFASSIFFPLTGLLLDHLGWRTTLLVLAGVLAVADRSRARRTRARPDRRRAAAPYAHVGRGYRAGSAAAERRSGCWPAAFVAQAAAVSAVGVLLVTATCARLGHAATVAATVSGLLGVLSVTGRLITTGVARRHGMTTDHRRRLRRPGRSASSPCRTSADTAGGAAVCVIAFGLGFGVATIAKPAIVADRYGTARYATIARHHDAPDHAGRRPSRRSPPPRSLGVSFTAAGVVCLASAGSALDHPYRVVTRLAAEATRKRAR